MMGSPDRIEVPPGAVLRGRLARWAVGLSGAVSVVIAISSVIFTIAYTSGGSSAISDNWVGFLEAVALLGGLGVLLFAFVLAIVARVKGDQWSWLWLPLAAFPTVFAFIALGEVFWWE